MDTVNFYSLDLFSQNNWFECKHDELREISTNAWNGNLFQSEIPRIN